MIVILVSKTTWMNRRVVLFKFKSEIFTTKNFWDFNLDGESNIFRNKYKFTVEGWQIKKERVKNRQLGRVKAWRKYSVEVQVRQLSSISIAFLSPSSCNAPFFAGRFVSIFCSVRITNTVCSYFLLFYPASMDEREGRRGEKGRR